MSRVHRPAWMAHPRVQIAVMLALLALIAVLAYPAVGFVRGSWHWRRAQAALAVRDFAAAQRHLDACRRAWPDSAETAFLAARTARRAGDLRTAAALLADARRLEWVPQQIDLEAALTKVQRDSYAPVVGYLFSCVRRDHPDSLLILEVLEPAAMRALDLPLATECADLWLARDPTNPRPHIDRGDLLERMRQRNDAVAEFRLAVQHAPDHVKARLRLARILTDLNISDEATVHYEWLAQRNPADPVARLGLARCRYATGRKNEAEELLDALLRDHPTNAGAMALRGLIELDSDRAAEAERWLRDALKQAPSDEALYNLERSLYAQGKTAEAEAAKKRREADETDLREVGKLMKEIAKNPTDPEPRRQVAALMISNGLLAEGKRWLELAIRLAPQYAPSYLEMAKYHEQMGDFPAAAECRAQAKRLTAKPK